MFDFLDNQYLLSLVATGVVELIALLDFLSFPTARLPAFLLVGCAGALWRPERAAVPVRPDPVGSVP